MSDIRTTQYVNVDGEYRVAVANASDQYEAAVVATHRAPFEQAMHHVVSLGQDTDEWSEIDDAPRVYSDQKYTAAGEAIEAYHDMLEAEMSDMAAEMQGDTDG